MQTLTRLSVISLSISLILGCAQQSELLAQSSASTPEATTPNSATPTSFFDYQFTSPDGQPLNLEQWAQQIDADVILVGEWHTHTGIHRFQTELLQELAKQDRKVSLSMEQFTRDKQEVVDQYLRSEIGEQTLIKQGNAWPNYESDYRPLVEMAKDHQMDIIAANAPKPIVRCIGQEGIEYINKLDEQQRSYLAKNINTQDSPYKQKFMSSLHHGSPEQSEKQFAAQVTWDETMAESIVNYLNEHPGAQVMHIAGKFHTEQGLGTAASILNRNPDLKVVVITPVSKLTDSGSDFQLQVLEPPKRFVIKENMMASFKDIAQRSDELQCKQ